jgi:hypothetical protein
MASPKRLMVSAAAGIGDERDRASHKTLSRAELYRESIGPF